MNTFNETLEFADIIIMLEHSKPHGIGYNIFEAKVLLALYNNFIRGSNMDWFKDGVPSRTDILMKLIRSTRAAIILGDDIASQIPNEKLKTYTDEDILSWAGYLYKKLNETQA